MDLIGSMLLYWPIRTILWLFPLIIVIYCAYKEGYKKASILLLCMVVSASFSWINQWNLVLFLEQASIFFIAAIIIVLDLVSKHKKRKRNMKDTHF